mmetsp:Transcript_34429/g.74688  ORF Transcript_34429/g.74688 Transcript_34429/m.74688 type:complete len:129 (-) Transcript_34429:269-655(-)
MLQIVHRLGKAVMISQLLRAFVGWKEHAGEEARSNSTTPTGSSSTCTLDKRPSSKRIACGFLSRWPFGRFRFLVAGEVGCLSESMVATCDFVDEATAAWRLARVGLACWPLRACAAAARRRLSLALAG